MSFALLSLPLSADKDGLPVLVLGLTDEMEGIVITDTGKFELVDLDRLTVEWRYDWSNHKWIDVGGINGTQNDGPDGGPSFSGSVPEFDRVGASDPLDPEGG